MRHHSGPFLSFLAYYMEDQFLHLLWRPPYVFFFILYRGPSDYLFTYYIGAPRSLSSLTIWGSPEIRFFAYYMRAPLRSVSSLSCRTADTDGGAYSPFRSILLVLTHDFIIIQLYGPACGDG